MRRLRGRVQVSIGWGTGLTNDFVGCLPGGSTVDLKAASLVCKVVEVEGRPAVKLSDNPAKFMGPADEVARYPRVLGYEPGARRAACVTSAGLTGMVIWPAASRTA